MSSFIKNRIKQLIKDSIKENTDVKSNQYNIEEGNYQYPPSQYDEYIGEGKSYPCFFVDVEEISSEEGWSRGDLIKIARDIKKEILLYNDEHPTQIKVNSFVDMFDNIVIQY